MNLEPTAALRRSIYFVLIAISLAQVVARIAAIDSIDKQALELKLYRDGNPRWQISRPFLSANDRSRWCTIRALVEQGTYVIDDVQAQPNWDTIDMVKHDGHLYSSKPPLLPTLLAGEYWLIYNTTGASLASHPYEIGRAMLVTINAVPLLVYFLILIRLVERYGQSDWGRIFVFAAAATGTMLTTFASTLNNHLPAAISALIALDATLRIWHEGERRARWFFIAGLFAAFTAANELPALIIVPFVGLALLVRDPRKTFLATVPAGLLVAAGFFGTNFLAHGTLIPAYGQRTEGANWYDYTYERNGKTIESYWRKPVGVDQGEPSLAMYAVHVLIGHHGVFSLTPVWLLSIAGIAIGLSRRFGDLRWIAAAIGLMTIVCLAFYLERPLRDRNYGGVASGFRWMFWFAPLWLWAMLFAADALATMQRQWLRALALVALAVSVFSASFPWNPWSHPWLYNFWQYLSATTL